MSNKITADQRKLLKARKVGNWRTAIAKHLIENGPQTAVQIFKATRAEDIPEAKMKHNVASQMTYLADDGYLWVREEDKFVLLADPDNNTFESTRDLLPKYLK